MFLRPAVVYREDLLSKLGLDPKRLTILDRGLGLGGAVASIHKALEQI